MHDHLWLVIDHDNRKTKELAGFSKFAKQKGFNLAISNPCFELWMLLHFEYLSTATPNRCKEIADNKNDFIKKELGKLHDNEPDLGIRFANLYFPNLELAIQRAEKLLPFCNTAYWPSSLGTWVYPLIKILLHLT